MAIRPGHGRFFCVDAELEYHLITANEVKLKPDTTTLILLHEGLGSVSMWGDFPEKLAQRTGHAVLSYSRVGYGKSDACKLPRTPEYMHVEARKYLPEVVAALDTDIIYLIGHSDGASISAIYAGETPDSRVKGLILMAPHFFTESVTIRSIRAARRLFATRDLRQRLEKHHGKNVDCAFKGWNDAWLDPEFAQWNISEFVPKIAVPILLIQGVGDQYGSVAQIDLVNQKSNVLVKTCLFEQCRHAPHRDQPLLTLDAISEFLCQPT